jgi:hypothetical protein
MILLLLFNFLLQPADTILNKAGEITGFRNAVSMTTDGKGALYVLDNESNEVLKLDSNLNLLKRAGGPGSEQLQFYYPTYIDASSGLDVFVSDGRNYRIQRLDLNLAFIGELRTDTKTFLEELRFNTPLASIVVNSNNLYVVDGDNNRIIIYDRGMLPNNTFGDFKAGEGRLVNPGKIQRDNSNFIYVLDRDKNGILKYDNFGNYSSTLSYPGIISFSAYNNRLYILTKEGIVVYNTEANSYENKLTFPLKSLSSVTDFLAYSNEKYFLLEKNKLSYWIINNN